MHPQKVSINGTYVPSYIAFFCTHLCWHVCVALEHCCVWTLNPVCVLEAVPIRSWMQVRSHGDQPIFGLLACCLNGASCPMKGWFPAEHPSRARPLQDLPTFGFLCFVLFQVVACMDYVLHLHCWLTHFILFCSPKLACIVAFVCRLHVDILDSASGNNPTLGIVLTILHFLHEKPKFLCCVVVQSSCLAVVNKNSVSCPTEQNSTMRCYCAFPECFFTCSSDC